MIKKERLLNAIQGKEVDRIPVMYRALPPLTKSLMKYFGIGDQDDPYLIIKNYRELFSLLGEVDYSGFGGSMFYSGFTPRFTGELDGYDFMDAGFCSLFGVEWEEVKIGKYDYSYMVISRHPWAAIEDPGQIKGLLTRHLDKFDYGDQVNYLLNTGKFSEYNKSSFSREHLNYESMKDEDTIISTGIFSASPFMYCSYLRGMDNFLMDMAGNKDMASAIIDEVTEYSLEFNRRSFEQSNIKTDLFICWDDICMQDGIMFSMEMFKKYFLPFWEEIISLVKKNDMFFGWHCCGNVNEVLPFMIDAGADMFDVLQSSAKDMDLDSFYKKFGKSICVQGGIDVQNILTKGTPEDIREEVKSIKELWGTRGNMILGPSHEALPETPLENILALYKEINNN